MNGYRKKVLTAIKPSLAAYMVILLLSYVSLNTTYGYIISVSFGATMVLLFGYPSSPFAQPKNIFFGHVITATSGIIFSHIALPLTLGIAAAVSIGIFFMILFDFVHPPAGGNPIAVLLGNHSNEFLFTTILLGTILILIFGTFINRYIFKIKYPN